MVQGFSQAARPGRTHLSTYPKLKKNIISTTNTATTSTSNIHTTSTPNQGAFCLNFKEEGMAKYVCI